jgi:hypothetical protein
LQIFLTGEAISESSKAASSSGSNWVTRLRRGKLDRVTKEKEGYTKEGERLEKKGEGKEKRGGGGRVASKPKDGDCKKSCFHLRVNKHGE